MKNKIIISSILTIAMCLSLIAGSTFALFTSNSEVNVAVTSGTVDVDVDASNLTIGSTLGTALGTANLTDNVITLTNLVPGDFVTFTLTITNKSNVTVNYRALVKTVEDKGLLDGLVITYNNAFASDWKKLEPTTTNVAEVVVTISLPEDANNDYQNTSCKLAYVVEAIQGNVDVQDGLVYKTDENGNKVIDSKLGTLPEKVSILEGTVALPSEYLNLGGHTEVKEVVIPVGLTDFGGTPNAEGTGASGGFFKKSAVEKVTLPDGMTEIPAAAFNQASSLTDVNIPSSVTKVGINSFAYTGLETLTVPATVENIGYGAFRGMANLTSVVIEGNVTIANFAFRSCASLETVILLGDDVTFLEGGQIFTKNDSGDAKLGVINVYVENETVKERLLAVTAYDAALNVVVGDPRVSTPEDVNEQLSTGGNVIFTDDVSAPLSGGSIYGTPCAISQTKGGVIDGNGHALVIENPQFNGYAIETYGGTIKNLVIESAVGRGIIISSPRADVYIDNVVIDGPGYAINTTEHNGKNLYVTDSTVNGWTSLAGLNHAYFTNCKLGENTGKYWQKFGYDQDYDRLIRPYCNATFTSCELEEGYYIDLSALGADCEIVLDNCTVNGVVLTADNYANYITIELPSGRTLADCVVFR